MWVPGVIGRRADPEGAALAVAIAGAVEELSWAEIAWLLDAGTTTARFELGGNYRTLEVVAGWDGDAWASDTWNSVRVSGVVRGTSRDWSHKDSAQHWGENVPETAPDPVAFDFEALVRRAVVAPD